MGGVGILGGTFNPVHIGHIRHAVEVGESLGLERVFLSPGAVPPHKTAKGILPFDLRLDMVRAAVDDVPLLEATGLEGEIEGPSYTYVVLQEWRRRNPGEDLPWFMMGVEDFAQLSFWHRGCELPTLARLVVVPRAGSDRELFRRAVENLWPGEARWEAAGEDGRQRVRLQGDGECLFLPVPRLDVSASFIRERWLAGRDVSGLLPCRTMGLLEERRVEAELIWKEADPA